MKTMRIRKKLLITSFLTVALATFPIAIISIHSLFQASVNQALDFGEKSAYYNSEIINTWLEEKSMNIVHLTSQISETDDKDEVERLLKQYSETNEDFISIFIGLEDNTMIDAYGWKPDPNYVVAERPWYIKAYDTPKSVTTSVYMDANKKEYVTALAQGIEWQGLKGVIAGNIHVDYIVDKMDSIVYGKSGFAVLLDDSNHLITGPQDEQKVELFNQINQKIKIDEGGLTTAETVIVDVESIQYIAAFSSIKGFNWNLFLIAPLDDFIGPAHKLKDQMIYTIAFILGVAIIFGYILSRSISKPIEKLIEAVSHIAKGDFENVIEIKSKDEIGELSLELDGMRRNLKKIFESIKYESRIIAMNSQSLSDHLKETYQGTYRFLSLLSHDIKTPVTLIKGYVKAIEMDMVDKTKEKEYIERIGYRADQIEKIVGDILDCTHEVNDMKINKKSISLSDYANMVVYNSENYCKNQNRFFVKEVQQIELIKDIQVSVDLIKIHRVINNILSNAIKFSAEGSIIKLVIKLQSDLVLTYIQDEGKGISMDEKDKIFNLFYQSEDSKKGYGLGLYINKAMIEAHQGSIYFDSKINHGTASGFYLPINKRTWL